MTPVLETAKCVNTVESTCHMDLSAHLFGATFQHLFIVLTIGSSQVGTEAFRRLIGQLDAILQ